MAWTSWTSLYVGDHILSEHVQQMRDNINYLAQQLSLAPFSWTRPISVGRKITLSSVKEVRDNADTLEDENYCHTHHSNHDSSDKSNHDVTVYNTHDSSEKTDHDNSRNGSHDASYNYSNLTAQQLIYESNYEWVNNAGD